jgi:hypothetical protein
VAISAYTPEDEGLRNIRKPSSLLDLSVQERFIEVAETATATRLEGTDGTAAVLLVAIKTKKACSIRAKK